MPPPTEMVREAARLCVIGYTAKPEENLPPVRREIDLYSISGKTLGFVKYENEVAYVVFRGTQKNEWGNWIFINAQAHKGTYRVPTQGGNPPSTLPGSIHQGFARAFSWLWYGHDVDMDPAVKSLRWKLFALRHATITACFLYGLFQWSLWCVLAVYPWAYLLLLELGVLEKQYHKELIPGENLCQQIPHLNECNTVVFSGHSLGGAMATLAFAHYMTARPGKFKEQNVYLVTFGAPRVGDQSFVDSFGMGGAPGTCTLDTANGAAVFKTDSSTGRTCSKKKMAPRRGLAPRRSA